MTDFRNELVGYIPHLRRYAWSLLRDGDEADDLVQECLVRAIRNQHSFRRDTNLRAWLFTILHNLYVDLVRKRATVNNLASTHDLPSQKSLEPNQMQSLDLVRLNWALSQLQEEQKSALLLVALEGMSYKETADITGVAVGTVKSRVSRARNALRDLMSSKGSPVDGAGGSMRPRYGNTRGPDDKSEKDYTL